MKILAILTSFHPEIDALERNIRSFLDSVDCLIIWENTPKEKSYINTLTDKIGSDKIIIRTTGKNEYLAKPFNDCIKWGAENGYTYVLTMDQDSYFADGHFENFVNQIEKYTETDLAAFGPNNNYRNQNGLKTGIVENLIISGAIYPIDVFLKVGGFMEELVIDAIDTEYCYRAKKQGFKIILISNVFLEHQLGYRHKHWTGFTLVPYSAQRTYYYLRNTFWLWREFPEYFKESYRKEFVKYRVVYRILKLVLEKNPILKLRAIIAAIRHYKSNRLGRYDKFLPGNN